MRLNVVSISCLELTAAMITYIHKLDRWYSGTRRLSVCVCMYVYYAFRTINRNKLKLSLPNLCGCVFGSKVSKVTDQDRRVRKLMGVGRAFSVPVLFIVNLYLTTIFAL